MAGVDEGKGPSRCSVVLDNGTGVEFDRVVAAGHRIHNDWKLVVKENATEAGKPAVAIAVGNQVLVVTVRNFLEAAAVLQGKFPSASDRAMPTLPAGSVLEGNHAGKNWRAILVEKIYIVQVDGAEGISLAGDEQNAELLAKTMAEKVAQ